MLTQVVKVVVVMTDAVALSSYTVLTLREETGPFLIPRNGCWLYNFFLEQLPYLFAVQSCVSVACRPQQLPLGDADLIDEQHHAFGIF